MAAGEITHKGTVLSVADGTASVGIVSASSCAACQAAALCTAAESARKVVVMIFRIVYVIAVPIGATGGLEFVWGVADTLNGCMAVPNLIGVLLLSGVVLTETKRYFTDLKKDKLQ